MSKQKKDKMDWCKNHHNRPREHLYKSIPYCQECFDHIIEEENKEILAEIKRRNKEKKKEPLPATKADNIWW
jgi:hypothetical protein